MQLIEMGDFAGALLKYIRKGKLKHLLLCGGVGKLSKLAQGHLDLHSSRSSIDFAHLADLASQQGASQHLIRRIQTAEYLRPECVHVSGRRGGSSDGYLSLGLALRQSIPASQGITHYYCG